MSHTRALILTFSLGLALSPDPAHAVGEGGPEVQPQNDDRVERIVGGETTTDWPAVVALMEQGQAVCTGTLIAPRVVLTAAHCLDYGGPDAVYFGSSPSTTSGQEVGASQSLAHPDYNGGDDDVSYDIGLVFLDADAPAEPRPVRAADLAPLVGEQILYVGFGETQGTGGDGLKKIATARITELYGDIIDVEPDNGSACYGDSGGPVFWDGDFGIELIGVVSFGYTDDCMDLGGNTRADLYVDWIEQNSDGVNTGDGNSDNGNGGGSGAPCEGDPEDWSDADWDAWEDGECDDPADANNKSSSRGRGCQSRASFVSSGSAASTLPLASLLLLAAARRRRMAA